MKELSTADQLTLERIRDYSAYYSKRVSEIILATPTGQQRNRLTNINVHLKGIEGNINELNKQG